MNDGVEVVCKIDDTIRSIKVWHTIRRSNKLQAWGGGGRRGGVEDRKIGERVVVWGRYQ